MIKRSFPLVRLRGLLLLLALLPAVASAQEPVQELTAEDVLARLRDSVDAIQDASFVLYGSLLADDGTQHRIEVETEIIPELELVRLHILQPDALADNFLILADDATYSYNYLTNQVFIYAPGDPTPFGPLAGNSTADSVSAGAEAAFRFTLDVDELFSGWDAELAGTADTDQGVAHLLHFVNVEADASIASARVTVPESTWLPLSVSVFSRDGNLLVELEVQQLETNSGLAAEDLLWLPSDAEVIDERR